MKTLLFFICTCVLMARSAAQLEAYRGGFSDGHGLIESVIPFTFPIIYSPFLGNNGSGYAKIEMVNEVFPFTNQFYAFLGGANDGWTGNLAPGVVILPLTLFQFSGDVYGAHNKLFWVTQNEQNTSHFIIEKSTNGTLFLPLARTEARGNYAGQTNYQVTDSTPGKGKTLYRIRMIDRDGSEKLSPIVLLKRKGLLGAMVLFPNPVQQQLQVRILQPSGEDLLWTISDATGRKLLMQKTAGNLQLYAVNIAHFPAGVYLLQVQQGSQLQTIQFIKQ